jgi:hypothetical protein
VLAKDVGYPIPRTCWPGVVRRLVPAYPHRRWESRHGTPYRHTCAHSAVRRCPARRYGRLWPGSRVAEGLGGPGDTGVDGSDADVSGGQSGGQSSGGDGGGSPQPGYPTTARAYAEATLAAYAAGQSNRLADLTTDEVYEQLLELPGKLKTDWLYLNCDGVSGASYCKLRNGDGDVITLKVSSQRLGGPDAATEVKANLTTYPADGKAYAREFVLAWLGRNTPRMRVLGNPDTVTRLNTDHPAPGGTYVLSLSTESGGGGLLLVTVPDGAGGTYVLHVGTTKLGKQHAVVGYEK